MTNVLLNPGFDGGIHDWSRRATNSMTHETTVTASGAGALRMQRLTDGGGPAEIYVQTVSTSTVTAGTEYTWAFSIKPVSASTARTARARIVFIDGDGANLSWAGPAFEIAANADWTRVVTSQVAPPGAARMRLRATLEAVAEGDTFVIDDAVACACATDVGARDGDFPGWQWAGTQGASESSGTLAKPW